MSDFESDISATAKAWMRFIGEFGPTVRADRRELKGRIVDIDGDHVKAYVDSGELRELAASCIEVADWLDKRAEQEQSE